MIVYIVTHGYEYEGAEVEGVFASLEDAQRAGMKVLRESHGDASIEVWDAVTNKRIEVLGVTS